MRKVLALLGLVAALAIPAMAFGVDINPSHLDTGCEGDGTYHFVAPGGGASSELTVVFSSGDFFTSIGPDTVTGGNAHWIVDASGTIESASATNARRLVLSDADCGEEPKDPDPKDPK